MNIDKEIKELNKQLYPTGRAWNYAHGSEQVDTEITQFIDGLNNPFVDGFGNHFISIYGSEASPSKRLMNAFLESYIRLYADILSILNTIIPDNDEFSTIDAGNWERVYALLKNSTLTLDERKQAILRKITYPNGIPERAYYEFIQDQLQASGFNVIVTENRFSDGGSGWDVIDPDSLLSEIANSHYLNKSFDLNSQEASPYGISFNSDGTIMYIVGAGNATIYTYDLSIAWDVSTAVYSGDSFSVTTQTASPLGIYISEDGLNLFISEWNSIVYKYTFSSAWDITTLSYSGQSYDSTTQIPALQGAGISFKADGTKMYLSSRDAFTTYQYTLGVAWDLTTVSYDSVSLVSTSNRINGISFNSDGTKFYSINPQVDTVREYNVGTAWDLSTAVFLSTFSIAAQSSLSAGIYFKQDGSIYYVVDTSSGAVYQYSAVFNYQICANFVDEINDAVFYDSPATVPTESGVYESGDAESGNTIALIGDTSLRFTFFIGSATLGETVDIPESRKDEFRQLILSLKPAHSIAYLFINYTT